MPDYSVVLTPEDVENATSYVDIATKEMTSRAVAYFCCEPVEVETTGGMKELPGLPFMVRENRKLRQQFQMGLLADYFGKEYKYQTVIIPAEDEPKEMPLPHCMDEEEYDRWAGSHVFNQLDRLKKSKDHDIADKVYDILYDYKCQENMISVAIRDEMEARNNGLNRAMEYLARFSTEEMSQAVMKSLMQSKEELSGALNEVEQYKKRKQGETDG